MGRSETTHPEDGDYHAIGEQRHPTYGCRTRTIRLKKGDICNGNLARKQTVSVRKNIQPERKDDLRQDKDGKYQECACRSTGGTDRIWVDSHIFKGDYCYSKGESLLLKGEFLRCSYVGGDLCSEFFERIEAAFVTDAAPKSDFEGLAVEIAAIIYDIGLDREGI